ncbi:hypothetical protein D3C84_957160 [compost metagenome]
MAFDLHLAEHDLQGADKIRNAMGQGQVDQFNARWNRQARIPDDNQVAVSQRRDQSRQRNVEQRCLFHGVLNACTSLKAGIEGCAPARVTDSAAATCPKRIACTSS